MQTADYETERESWVQRGVQVLKALDGLADQKPSKPTRVTEAAIDKEIDDEIEQAIARYREKAH
jgi:hypothetical protein